MAKHIANIVTSCRILGSILLLLFPAFSVAFYILYLLCGFSDMIDGTIAKKTNSISKFGSQLDTVADLIFVVASAIRLLPAIHIPGWLWIWSGVIAILKISSIIWGYVSKKKFISLHTIMNKLTGLLLFLLPLTISFVELKYTAIVVFSVATFSAIQESVYVITDCSCKQANSNTSNPCSGCSRGGFPSPNPNAKQSARAEEKLMNKFTKSCGGSMRL